MKTVKNYLSNPYLALMLGLSFNLLGSPKWTVFIGPWIGIPFILYFFRKASGWKAYLFAFAVFFISGFIGLFEVFPAPLPILLIILIIVTVKSLIPYLLDKWAGAGKRGFAGTLIFPAALVVMEYVNTLDSGDVWSSVANTQYEFLALQQVAAVFGIWGITFLIGWFASLMNWMADTNWGWKAHRKSLLLATGVYILAMGYGTFRITMGPERDVQKVQVAGITMNNSNIMEQLYYDVFQKTIDIPTDASQTSPILQEANKAMVPFIENPDSETFTLTRKVIEDNLNLLLYQSRVAAKKGARIIVWSEAIGLILDSEEDAFLKKAAELAQEEKVYLLVALGVVQPGPVTADRLLLINKTVAIGPEGKIENEYLKSNPVPFAEQDYGSDDIIPLIETPYGGLSPVICYDADFPHFMKQAGKNGADILLVPSGDWKAIDPYHPFMARLRGIENGVSVVRPVSRATSIISDPYGRVLGSDDYFGDEDHLLMASVPVKGVNTIYSQIGDVLAYFCMAVVAGFLGMRIRDWFILKSDRKRVPESTLSGSLE